MARAPNVLITSAAAKVVLVRNFQDALGGAGKAFTADLTADCAAAHLSDGHFTVGPMAREGAIDELIELCRANDVGVLIPSRDGELPALAVARERFAQAGVFVHVAAPQAIAVCQDKRVFAGALAARGLPPVPMLDRAGDADFPVFVRPATGAGGRGARRIDTPAELAALECPDQYLVHPLIRAPEYTIDLLMDLEGQRALDAVCRERIQVVAGESKISRVMDVPELAAMTKRMGEALSLVGHNTVQAFLDPERGPLFIEVNPRFGGASNLSIRAGLESPLRILQMLRGDEAARAPHRIAYGATMFRYSQDVIVGG